jgi:hypothetical protein
MSLFKGSGKARAAAASAAASRWNHALCVQSLSVKHARAAADGGDYITLSIAEINVFQFLAVCSASLMIFV